MVSTTPTFEVRLFGGFDTRLSGSPLPSLRSRREQWMLALLVLRYDRDTAREWLATTLWPDNDEQQALFYLRKSLSNLRQALGTEATRLISPTPRTIRLEMTNAFADVLAFDSALKRLPSSTDPIKLLQEAITLYRGPLLPDCLEEWITAERNQREQAYLTSLEMLATHFQTQTDPSAAIPWLRLLTTADPFRESAHRSLMQALADCGDTAEVTAVYQKLRALLRQELNTAPAPETEAFYRELLKQERQLTVRPPTGTRESRRHLPSPLSDLIGRKQEIAEVLEWLEQRRLVTLLGAGGIGKTRLAIAVADSALPRFDHGVWFVDLAALSDASLVPQIMAKALGLREESGRSLSETLVDFLSSRSLLLVMDNCEHLIEACATLAYDLLYACPELRILTTSREALDVMGEQVYRVPSLLVPPHEESASPLMEYEAVQLFVDRASRVDSEFRLLQENASPVVGICRQLDGIPLAIEMAAARLRSLSVSEINSRLDHRFHLLTSGNRGVLPRHQTLRAAIDWSYEQLSESERSLLRRVSVFTGGWTGEAATTLCIETTEPTTNEDISDLLKSLTDKSLAITEERETATRYRLLETIRQYGQELLTENSEDILFRERHRDYFLALAEQARPKLSGSERAEWLSILDTEQDNLRQALAFCREVSQPAERGLRLAASLWGFWLSRGSLSEGCDSLAAALAHPGANVHSKERADALNGAGVLSLNQGNFAAASRYHDEGLIICRELGDKKSLGFALNNRANVAATQGDFAFARPLYAEALAIFRESGGSKQGLCDLLNNLGNVTNEQGDYETARTLQEESLEIAREIGDRQQIAICLNNLGILAEQRDDYATARSLYEESLEIHRQFGPRTAEAANLGGLGNLAYHQGDYTSAYPLYEESLKIRREVGDLWGTAISLQCLGMAAFHLGDTASALSLIKESLVIRKESGELLGIMNSFNTLAEYAASSDQAAQLWGAATALRERIGAVLQPRAQKEREKSIAKTREAMDETSFNNAWEKGYAMSLEESIAYALHT